MKLSIVLFLIGITMIGLGVARQMTPPCKDRVDVRYVARNIYDDLLRNSPKTNADTN